ncbi:hypothetical protein MIND_01016200 [Mycena indigotica]|uniref:Monopolin complex subunit Csm1/Pcs1 C-terminal domain-containing protein n=1 Tax=Mycena indigotica TaxID=2126181 RepID=A0A8H6S855_9AGAR|nr:uncharacterized protein MIND_01016200 [Mycena indigotica]KAF7294785.1 hypothetical protein MIND_01016200 [Mycena indigotica]
MPARAGPSTAKAAARTKPRAATTEDEEEITVIEPRKVPARASSRPAASKGKGKAKAEKEVEIVEQSPDELDDPGPANGAPTIAGRSRIQAAPTTNKSANFPVPHSRQTERLTRRLEQANKHIAELEAQLKEAYRVRTTEAEDLLAQQLDKHQEVIRAKDDIIKQQAEMLSHKEPLASEGKTSVLYLVTREQADADKRSAEEQVTFWKREADQRADQVEELKQKVKDLEYEVEFERENATKARQQKGGPLYTPAPASGRNVLGASEPKHAELIKFYEDMTNTLVTDIKLQEPKFFNLDEWLFTCIYTYVNKEGENQRSLGFSLRFTHEPLDDEDAEEPQSVNDLEKRVRFTPLTLDKESPEFVNVLDFLGGGFTFQRTQLPLFFSSLLENMKRACEPPPEEEDDSMEVQ